ncbi:hypothetical protein Tco_1234306 [Tanacetum coccineum]
MTSHKSQLIKEVHAGGLSSHFGRDKSCFHGAKILLASTKKGCWCICAKERCVSRKKGHTYNFSMADLSLLEELGKVTGSSALHDLALDYVDYLKSMQMKELEKLRILNGLLVDSGTCVRERETYVLDMDGY